MAYAAWFERVPWAPLRPIRVFDTDEEEMDVEDKRDMRLVSVPRAYYLFGQPLFDLVSAPPKPSHSHLGYWSYLRERLSEIIRTWTFARMLVSDLRFISDCLYRRLTVTGSVAATNLEGNSTGSTTYSMCLYCLDGETRIIGDDETPCRSTPIRHSMLTCQS